MQLSTADVRIGVVVRPQVPPEQLTEAARQVEGAGCDLWLWEDSFWNGGVVTSTTALASTSQLVVGLGLMPTPLRNPALAAMEVAALARLHPGRFLPAFGHGIRDWMTRAGAAVESPLTLMGEYVPAVRALLRGEEVTVGGRYVNLDRVRLEFPPPVVPPVLIGANGPKALHLAGSIGDGVVLGDIPTLEAAAAAVDAVTSARSSSALANEPFHIVGYVEPADDPASQARELASAGLTSIVFTSWEGDPDPRLLFEAASAAQAALKEER